MKKILVGISLIAFRFAVAQSSVYTGVVPAPASLVVTEGNFVFGDETPVFSDPAFMGVAALYAQATFLSSPKAYRGKLNASTTKGIYFLKQRSNSKEAYRLLVNPFSVLVIASDQSGATHGMETLLQLQLLQPDRKTLPCLSVADTPAFAYRGLMLDVSRHFYPVSTVKKMIDMMALYKLNTLHLHLADAAGWRIEIKQYPELTHTAAWRTEQRWKDWWNGNRHYSTEGEPGAYGGYYTQQEARQLVKYAADRSITIIPEIEMPGHSEEVMAVFPQLACSGKPYTQGELCLGNDSTFIVLQNILKEIIDIFPSRYIHIGGDEAGKAAWKKCPKCQARIRTEHLADEHELQSYGIRRMEKFLSRHGRHLLGWDEILEGGLAPGATVMSWRGESGGIKAAKTGHDVIMSPGGYCYFDAYQANPATQPEAIGGFLPISKVYSYNPVPGELNSTEAKHILGVQANVWTEYIPTTEHLEYMIFPRLLALAETGWTKTANKNWASFEERLQQQYLVLQRRNINYYRPIPNLEIKAEADTNEHASLVRILSEQYKPDIRYTTDGSDPTVTDTRYINPFFVKDTTTIKAAIVQHPDSTTGPVASLTTAYHKAVGAKVMYNLPYSKNYPAQKEYTLVNGQKGSFTYGDGQWQGFDSGDMDVTVELKNAMELKNVSISFMQLTGPGVYMPGYVEFSWSEDGKTFSHPVRVENNVPATQSALSIQPFKADIGVRAKYIKVFAQNDKKGFLFADEIMIF
ncbi:MAG: family 20 glycosylhydrolase [Bacteroidetes bacterium]|nr:family 20 glycosylhydrolase [Bacteroidota bacterium]